MGLLTVKDVAQRLNVSAACVYALAESGNLVGYKIGLGRGTWRFAEDDVLAYLEAAKRPARTAARQKKNKSAPFEHLDGERLREAWKREGVSVEASE